MYLSKNFKHSRAKNTFKIAWSDAINFHLPCKKMALLSIIMYNDRQSGNSPNLKSNISTYGNNKLHITG